MKKTTLIITVLLALTIQLKAEKKPLIKEGSPLIAKDKKDFLAKPESSERTSRQVIKMNLSQLVFKNFSFQYEYGFHKNMSGALGVSILMPRNISSIIYSPPSETEGWQLPKFNGFAITPEFRFYPGEKVEHQAPHGFYIAPYFRYAKYSLKAEYLDIVTNSGPTHTNKYNVVATYSGFTAGLMIGSQWIIDKHFSIDWWILGGGAGKAKFQIEATETTGQLVLSALEQADLKADMNTNVGELGTFGKGIVDITTTSNSAKVVVKGVPMSSIRSFGLNIGFAF